MYVRYTIIADGPGPAETLVGVQTAEGSIEEVVLSKRHIQNGVVDVGASLLEREGNYLIELPRESTSGRWRVWVPETQVVQSLQAAE